MDRGSVVGGKSTTNQVLKNKVIKNVPAIKSNNVYELDLNYGTSLLVLQRLLSNKLMN